MLFVTLKRNDRKCGTSESTEVARGKRISRPQKEQTRNKNRKEETGTQRGGTSAAKSMRVTFVCTILSCGFVVQEDRIRDQTQCWLVLTQGGELLYLKRV